MKIIAVAGQRKSGKDVFTEYILKHYPQFFHVRIAEAPYLIAKILHLPPDRKIYDTLSGVNKLLFPILKESAYKRRAAQILDEKKPRLAIVEALRTKEEYEEFVMKRKGILIGITSSSEVRYKRALEDRRRTEDKKDEGGLTFKKFLEIEKHPMQRQIRWIVKRAHFVVHNDYSSPRFYHREVDRIMKVLGFRKRSEIIMK